MSKCACGCGGDASLRKTYIWGHQRRTRVSQLCLCGCGTLTTPGCKYISGHHAKIANPFQGKSHSEATKAIIRSVRAGTYKPPQTTICGCGCGETTQPGKTFILNHRQRLNKKIPPPQAPCACGCGNMVTREIYWLNGATVTRRFISGHQNKIETRKELTTQTQTGKIVSSTTRQRQRDAKVGILQS